MFIIQEALLLISIIPLVFSEDCQPSPDHDDDFMKPKVPHVTLDESYLSPYSEIFIVGDIHGCLDETQNLLRKANATSDSVLKIFTGDIARKGPKNFQSLQFVRQCRSCLTVRGNNDDQSLWMIHVARRKNKQFLPWDRWMRKATPEDEDFLRELPYTISIPSLNAMVVHAGLLPGGVPLEKNNPWTMTNIRDVIPKPECEGGYEPTRELEALPWAALWQGPQHLYFGHDHKRQLQKYPFATGVDGSCVRGHYMAGVFIFGPREGKFVIQDCPIVFYPGGI